jgi:hypothetical protein
MMAVQHPFSHLIYGAWPVSGEIDVAELFSQYPTQAISSVHSNNSPNDPDATNDKCVIGDPPVDGVYLRRHNLPGRPVDAASPRVDPAPFNQPFYVCLTQALGIGLNLFIPGTTPLPPSSSVDWVRIWGIPPSPG